MSHAIIGMIVGAIVGVLIAAWLWDRRRRLTTIRVSITNPLINVGDVVTIQDMATGWTDYVKVVKVDLASGSITVRRPRGWKKV